MEFIYSLLSQFFNLIGNFQEFISTNFIYLKEEVPAIVDVLNFIKDSIVIFLKGYNFLFLLKFVLGWFPNINPFIAPYFIVYVYTQPLLEYVEKRLPKLFGLDLSFLFCSVVLGFLTENLAKFHF